MKQRKAYSRVEVKRWVVAEMLQIERSDFRRRLTAGQIAKRLGRTPSTKFRKILAEMVENGTLIRWIIWKKSNVSDSYFEYELNPKKYPVYIPSPRTIKLNGQQTLFDGM